MNNMQKNIVVGVMFAISIASIFLVESNIIQAVLIAITLVVVLALYNQASSIGSSSYMDKKRAELIEMMEF